MIKFEVRSAKTMLLVLASLLLPAVLLLLLLSPAVGGSRRLDREVLEDVVLMVSRLFSSARRRSTGLELGTMTPLDVTAHLPDMKASRDMVG